MCGNCQKVGHLFMECPEPKRSKLMVKFSPDPKEKQKVEQSIRLVFLEVEDTNNCNFIVEVVEDPIGRIDHKPLMLDGNNEYIVKATRGRPLLS